MEELLQRINVTLGIIDQRILSAASANRRKQEYLEKYQYYKKKYDLILTYEQSINDLLKIIMVVMTKIRNETIANLENRIATCLFVLFPTEDFKVKITYELKRNNYESVIYLGKTMSNGTIRWGTPRANNGDFVKQLVSFAMLGSMNILLHSKFLCLDEPFSSSDLVNVTRLKPVFEFMQEQGLQLTMIEHKPELYQHLDHNLISLYKHRHPSDEHKGYVVIESTERKYADETAGSERTSESI